MPTLISNSNYAVRWDKTDCDNYTITNLSDQYNANVTVTDKTGTWTETFVLQPSASNSITLPGDGVFEVCAYLFDIPINLDDLENNFGFLSINNFGDQNPTTVLGWVILGATFNNGGVITNILETVDFSNPPTTMQPLIDAMQLYLDANGGGLVTLLLPGEGITNVVPITNEYRIVVQANNVQLITTTYEDGAEPIELDSDLFCNYNYILTEDRPFIFSLIINGTEVVPAGSFFDFRTQESADEAKLIIDAFLGGLGDSIVSPYNLTVNIVSGPQAVCDDVTGKDGEFGPGQTECDYIYEFCDLYACLSRLMNRWLCSDPCADSCTTAGETYVEARNKAVELSTMFFHALMPLVSTDRIWYFGNWSITDQRICNVNNIIELYSKMRDYVSNCGFDCGCGCQDPCEPCDPCDGYSYQPSLSNPSTPCGCK